MEHCPYLTFYMAHIKKKCDMRTKMTLDRQRTFDKQMLRKNNWKKVKTNTGKKNKKQKQQKKGELEIKSNKPKQQIEDLEWEVGYFAQN